MSADFGEGVVYAVRDVTEERALDTLRSEFVTTASHELRTPMTSISGAARTLLRHGDRLRRPGHQTFLEMIVAESDRLADRRPDPGREPDRGGQDRRHVRAHGRRRDRALGGRERAPRRARGDRVRRHRPTRARDRLRPRPAAPGAREHHRQRGQVLARGRSRARGVAVVDEAARFGVHDAGIGFDPSAAEAIFDRFRRLDPHQTRGIGGTGLGLYISRELVGAWAAASGPSPPAAAARRSTWSYRSRGRRPPRLTSSWAPRGRPPRCWRRSRGRGGRRRTRARRRRPSSRSRAAARSVRTTRR